MRLGVVTTGMSGAGSGSWNLLVSRLTHLATAGVELFVQGYPRQLAGLQTIPLTGVWSVDHSSRPHRFIRRRQEIAEFGDRFDLDLIQLEAPPFVTCGDRPVLAVLHDVRHLEQPLSHGMSAEKAYQVVLLRRSARRVAGVLTLSEQSKRSIVEHVGLPPECVHIVPPITGRSGKRPPFDERASFALVLGHLERRKNVETVLRASADQAWPEDLDLVIAGRDAGSLATLERLATLSRCRVHFTGAITDDAKTELLESAKMVLIPSLLEGFGIVALESAAAGTPFLVSDREPLKSLARTDDARVPTLDPQQWARTARHIHRDSLAWSHVVEEQRSTALACDSSVVIPALLDVYQDVVHQSPRSRL